jgi:phytoene/squalene synthetase
MNPSIQQYLDILDRIPVDRITHHPNILVAAGFWDEERYHAAKVCYRFMREIDDMIDDYKATHTRIREEDRERFTGQVERWLGRIRSKRTGGLIGSELIRTIRDFRIPVWPIENFARSMVYDIHHDGFPSVDAFFDYSEGASVAPSSIFVHLCGITYKDGAWQEPAFDVREAATPCARFSYLVHIMRDFRKDQLSNLSYFADDRIAACGLSRDSMRKIAEGAPPTEGFRTLMHEYCRLAESCKEETWKVLDRISPLLEPRYHLSLLIIFNLYLMVFERIDPDQGTFTTEELNPSPEEIHERVKRTILDFRHRSINN